MIEMAFQMTFMHAYLLLDIKTTAVTVIQKVVGAEYQTDNGGGMM